jgi:UDP:flavonoid glycosyltransferase YjiC (YdhE family)
VLSDATYSDNARRMQQAIVKTDGLSLAADLVEQSLEATTMASVA